MADQAVETLLASGTQASDVEDWDEKGAEQRLIAVLDRAAERFGALLDDDTRDEDNRFVVTLDQRLELFKLIREWIAIRRRTKIEESNATQTGVDAMQKQIAEGRNGAPTTKEAKQPERRGPGRPSNAEKARRAEEEERRRVEEAKEGRNDDSGWQHQLAAARNGGAR